MRYLIAAYAVTVLSLVVYAAQLLRERWRLSSVETREGAPAGGRSEGEAASRGPGRGSE